MLACITTLSNLLLSALSYSPCSLHSISKLSYELLKYDQYLYLPVTLVCAEWHYYYLKRDKKLTEILTILSEKKPTSKAKLCRMLRIARKLAFMKHFEICTKISNFDGLQIPKCLSSFTWIISSCTYNINQLTTHISSPDHFQTKYQKNILLF